MKKKLSFIALFVVVTISALLVSGCDILFGNDDPNNDNGACPPHTWKWVITPHTPVISGGDEEDDGEEDDENYSIATQRCTKCNATGRTIIVPEGTDISDLDDFDDTDGNVYIPPNIPQIPDAEWQRIIDRVNLLVDNHFENRNYSEGEKANWNIAGLSVGIYKNGRTAFFNRGFHESEQRNLARRRPVTENSIFMIGSLSKPVSNILFSYFSRINNPATGKPYVNLNDPLNNYFKTKPYIDTDGTQVHPTLLQFATHYAGVPRYVGTGPDATFGTLDRFKSTLENLTYTSKPGTAYNYSMGAAVVANVIASIYYNDFPQRRTGDLLTEQLFSPLGMNSSMLHGWVNPAMHDRLALPHNFSGTARSLNLSEDKSVTLIGASGEITSTTSDMIRLAAFIVGDNVPAGTGVLQQAAAAGIGWGTGNRSVPNSSLSPNASNASKLGGWFGELFSRPSNSGRYGRTLAHGGTVSGYQSYMMICPETKTAVVVMVNTLNARGSLAQQIMDRALNATYPINTGIASYTEARAVEGIPRPKTPFNDFDDLVESYAVAKTNVDIVLNEDLTIELPMNNIRTPATAGITLTIRSANPSQPVTLTRGVSGNLFTVPYGATLIFRDIIIDGGRNGAFADNGGGTLVRVNSGGSFIMNTGAVLRNNVNSGEGGGVFVNTSGSFTMNLGTISGNNATTDGGVRVNGTFNMNGGKISGNTAVNNGGGVGATGGTFTMSGGEISGNEGAIGGGVRINSSSSVFTLADGKISNNTARDDGGGVSVVSSAIFTMNGGEINGNTAATDGGGVFVNTSGTFTMSGGEINGNKCKQGGGVRLSGGSVFTLSNGKISNNTAATNGGGVSIASAGSTFNFNGGEISGNSADLGGAVHKNSSGTFTMSGGIISGNSANSTTGVRNFAGPFNLNGGVVAGTGTGTTGVVYNNLYYLNEGTDGAPNNAIVIAWNRPSGELNYADGSSTNLTVSAGGTAVWEDRGGVLGISYSYANGTNTGWIKAW